MYQLLRLTFGSMRRHLLITILSVPSLCIAQPSGMQEEAPSFPEIRARFLELYSTRPVARGAGFNKFKRWEAYWEPRVDREGGFPPMNAVHRAWTEYLAEAPARSHAGAKSVANWTEEGPTSFVFQGFGGLGRVNCLAFHPTEAATFWAGTPGGGLWKTTDGGMSWSTINSGMPVLGVSDIAVHPSDPDILYIATGDAETALVVPSSTKSIGVWKSIDGGSTWSVTGLSMDVVAQKLIGRLLISPADPQVLLAAASDGIWRTTDGGANWVNAASGWFIDMEFKPEDPQVVYASTLSATGNAQIHRSSDGGITWSQATAFTGASRIALAVTPAAPTAVMAVCADMQGLGGLEGLYYSGNSGASFGQAIDGSCANNMLHRSYDASSCGGQGVFDLVAAIDPLDPARRWIGGINLWRTGDAGMSWQLNSMWTTNAQQNPNGTPFLHSDKHCIQFHPQFPQVVFTCSDGGLHLSNDQGITWYDRSSGMGISQMYKVGLSASEPDRALCGLQDNGLKQMTGASWMDHIPGDHMECIIDPVDPDVQYSCALTGLLYRTTDNWANRTLIADNIPGFTGFVQQNGFGPGAWVTPLAMDPADHETLLIGFNEVWRSSDQGDSWVQASSFNSDAQLRSLVIAPSNNQVIYAATYDTLHRTFNGGADWETTPVSAVTGEPGPALSSIIVSGNDPLLIWATFSGYDLGNKVHRSEDGGLSWSNVSGSLPNVPVNCGVFEAGSNDALYIGTDAGVFHRDAGMPDWEPFDTGMPRVQVNDLEIHYTSETLYAATFGRGLWSTPLAEPAAIAEPARSDQGFALLPGPVAGTISVRFAHVCAGRLDVLTATGQRVLSSPTSAPSAIVDLRDVAPGMYVIVASCANGLRQAQRWMHR
jgi:photosystem II stability/assembly factor-like uncharacterized protein